jgi:hypothetical protein
VPSGSPEEPVPALSSLAEPLRPPADVPFGVGSVRRRSRVPAHHGHNPSRRAPVCPGWGQRVLFPVPAPRICTTCAGSTPPRKPRNAAASLDVTRSHALQTWQENFARQRRRIDVGVVECDTAFPVVSGVSFGYAKIPTFAAGGRMELRRADGARQRPPSRKVSRALLWQAVC